ncbi:MAG: hypothetical protein H6Q91_2842 [Deltaproteobacteria bacterium]|nr:hypothetical protein [Deltaproteobacteria bacterium]
MQALGGVVTLLNCVLCGVIGVRLIRFAARSKGPEAWLGGYLLAGTLFGTLLSSAVYISWSDPRVALPPGWLPPLHALQFLANTAGMIAILMFTHRVFRPRARWARRAAPTAAALSAVAFFVTAAVERFEVHVIPNPAYLAVVATRVAAMVWMTVESLLYFGQLRKRQRLGIADPLLVNRFLLWGIWAGSVSLMQLADPIGRFWYWWITGTTVQWIPEVGRTIIVFLIASTSALGAVTAATLFLTFFPTAAYKRWVAARAITE